MLQELLQSALSVPRTKTATRLGLARGGWESCACHTPVKRLMLGQSSPQGCLEPETCGFDTGDGAVNRLRRRIPVA